MGSYHPSWRQMSEENLPLAVEDARELSTFTDILPELSSSSHPDDHSLVILLHIRSVLYLGLLGIALLPDIVLL